MILNDQILYLKHVKDELSRNPSTVFRVRVRALFEQQNRSKVAFAFVSAAVAQWLERSPRERGVVGSIPDRVIPKTL